MHAGPLALHTNLAPCGYANSIPPALPLNTQGVLPSPLKLSAGPSLAARLAGHVINLNVPKAEAVVDIQGYQLAWQGQHCHFPDWKASVAQHKGVPGLLCPCKRCGIMPLSTPGCMCPGAHSRYRRLPPHPVCCSSNPMQELEADEHVKEGHAGAVTLRAFRNAAGSLRSDASEGCDSAAVQQGWVAVTPIALRSDVPLTAEAAQQRLQPQLLQAVAAAMQAAANSLGVGVRGVPAELLAADVPAEGAAAVATELQPEAVAVGNAV